MHIYIYVYIYLHVHTRTCTRAHTRTRTHTHTYTHTHTHRHTNLCPLTILKLAVGSCVLTAVCVCMFYVCERLCVSVCMCARVHVCV